MKGNQRSFTVCEHGFIAKSSDSLAHHEWPNVLLPPRRFDLIEQFVKENELEGDQTVTHFLIPSFKRNVGDILKAQNYVGLIETKDGTVIEILPKIYRVEDPDQNRRIFLRMLKALRNTPFKHLELSHLRTARMPLFEIFIKMFLDEVSILIKRGLKQDYITKEENSLFLKGKLKVGDHLKTNYVHKERFFVQYDEFLKDRPENRLIKSTLCYLGFVSKSMVNQKRIKLYLLAFTDVKLSQNHEHDFSREKKNRLMKDYYRVLRWCRVFLKHESFTNFKGTSVAFALLFPMERIFEDYVGQLVKRYHSLDFDVTLQQSREYLIVEQRKFRLVPDIYLADRRDQDSKVIMDTKWKLIDEANSKANYGIAQSDLYQMYAYAKKYQARRVILIYPKSDDFTEPIDTIRRYEEKISIAIKPFDLSKSEDENALREEVGSLLQ